MSASKFFSAFFVCLLFSNGIAEEHFSLAQCMQKAYKNSNILQISDLQIEIARDKLAQSEYQRLPSLTAQGSYLRIGKVSSFSIPMGPGGSLQTFKFGTPNRVNAAVNLGVPLFTWGRISAQIRMAAISVEMNQTERKQKALEVTDQVLRAFYGVFISQEAIEANKVNVERAQKNLETTKRRFEHGLAAKLHVLQAQVQATNAQTMLDDSQSALEANKLFLSKLIGQKKQNYSVTGALDYKPVLLDADSLIQRALSNRYDLLTFTLQQQLLQGQTKLIKTSLRPTLMGIGGYTIQNGFSPMNPEEFIDNWNVGLQVSLPLYDGGVTQRKIQETQKQVSAVQLQQKEIEQLVTLQIRQALVALDRAERNVLAQRGNIKLAQQALASAEEQYKNGLASSLDLITAQQTLAQSELGLLRGLYQHVLAKIELCKATADYTLFENVIQNNRLGL